MREVLRAGPIRLLEHRRTLVVDQVLHYRRRQWWTLALAVGAIAALIGGSIQLVVALPLPTSEQGAIVALLYLKTFACVGWAGWLNSREPKTQPLITFDLSQKTASWPVAQTPFHRVRLVRIQRGFVDELVMTQGSHRLILGKVGLGHDLSRIERLLQQHLSEPIT